jgi:transposase InsO family protein
MPTSKREQGLVYFNITSQLAKIPKPIVATKKRERCQIDTTYMTSRDIENPRGFKYILMVIDCFTKNLWAFAMKNRAAKDVMEHLEPLLEKENSHYSDR